MRRIGLSDFNIQYNIQLLTAQEGNMGNRKTPRKPIWPTRFISPYTSKKMDTISYLLLLNIFVLKYRNLLSWYEYMHTPFITPLLELCIFAADYHECLYDTYEVMGDKIAIDVLGYFIKTIKCVRWTIKWRHFNLYLSQFTWTLRTRGITSYKYHIHQNSEDLF